MANQKIQNTTKPRKPYVYLNPAQATNLYNVYTAKNISLKKAGEMFGVSAHTAQRIVAAIKTTGEFTRQNQIGHTDKFDAICKAYFEDGLTYKQISQTFGVSTNRISNYADLYIEMHPEKGLTKRDQPTRFAHAVKRAEQGMKYGRDPVEIDQCAAKIEKKFHRIHDTVYHKEGNFITRIIGFFKR